MSEPAIGMASSAPRMPASWAPISTAHSTASGELHRPPVDQRLQDVVLELLVGDEEPDHDQAPDPVRLDEDDRRDEDGGEGRASQRDEVEHGDEEPERDRVFASDAKRTIAETVPATREMSRLPVT